MKKLGVILAVAASMNACSFSNSTKEEVVNKPSDELEFVVDSAKDAVPDIVSVNTTEIKVEEQKIIPQKVPDEVVEIKEPNFNEYKKEIVTSKKTEIAEKPIIKDDSENYFPNRNQGQYQMQPGETLMMVAYKIYGDYRKWHELKELNNDKKIGMGSVITYKVPDKVFGWRPSGLPYLVKSGDTLGLISKDRYGTVKKWKAIYENNRPLIHSPNLIFAGFTIYYIPVREVASDHK